MNNWDYPPLDTCWVGGLTRGSTESNIQQYRDDEALVILETRDSLIDQIKELELSVQIDILTKVLSDG